MESRNGYTNGKSLIYYERIFIFRFILLSMHRYSCCYNSFELDQAESRRIEKCYISYIPVANRWKESLVIRENESE